ncbi:MAG: SPOR domain-containing protein [Nitrospirota bacterium]
MKRLLLFFSLSILPVVIFAFPETSQGEWQYLCTSETGNQLYFDRENTVLQLLIKINSSEETVAEDVRRFGIHYGDKKYTLIFIQLSCFSKMFRISKFTEYDAQGAALFSDHGDQAWKAIEPESMIESLYMTLCKQQQGEIVQSSAAERKPLFPDNAKPEIRSPAPAQGENQDQENYSVQIGAFRKVENALFISREFQEKGYVSRISEKHTVNGTLFRVLVGKFRSRSEAAKLVQEIESREHINAIIAMH